MVALVCFSENRFVVGQDAIGVLAPLTFRDGRETDVDWGEPIRLGCRLAVEAARDDASLTHLNLTLVEADTRGDAGSSFIETLALSNLSVDADTPAQPVYVAIGPTYTSTSLSAALVARSFDLPLISPSATSPSLSDTESYPTFSRTCSSDVLQGKALARLVYHFGVTACATLSTTESYSSRFTAAFLTEADDLGIFVESVQNFDEHVGDITTEVANIRNTGVAVVVLLLLGPDVITAFKEFDEQDMINEHYMYFGGDGWIDVILDSPAAAENISEATVTRWLSGAVGTTGYVPRESEEYQAFEARWQAGYAANNADFFNLSTPTSWSAYAYDATWLAIQALNQWIEIPEQTRQKTDLLSLIRSTTINGVTGTFQLDENGDRQGDFFVFNYDGTSSTAIPIGRVHNSAETVSLDNIGEVVFPGGVGVLPESYFPISCASDGSSVAVVFNRDECNFDGNWRIHYEFVRGERPCLEDVTQPAADPDDYACDYLPYRSTWSIILIVAVSTCVVLTLASLVFVIVFRKHKVLIQSQPEMISATIIGALLAQTSVFTSLGPITDDVCIERATMPLVAWLLFFSGIFFKAKRALEIRQKRVVWTPLRQRLLRLSPLVFLQIVLFVIWVLVAPPKLVETQQSVESADLPLLPLLSIGMRQCQYFAGTSDYVFFYPLMLVINYGWVLYTVGIAYRIHDVKFNHKEALLTSCAVLLILLCAVIAAPFFFVTTRAAKATVPRNSLLVLFAVTGTVLLYIVPKILRLLRTKHEGEETADAFGSLESLLDNDISAFYLREYLKTVYATESVEFLDSVMKFQLLVEDSRVSDEACLQKCIDIFEFHLEKNAENQVNISGDLRQQTRDVVDHLQKNRCRPHVAVFDACVFECKKLIFTNHYFSFLQNGESFAAQRALEWASEYKKMKDKLQRSVVTQLFKEYRNRRNDRKRRSRVLSSSLAIEPESAIDQFSSATSKSRARTTAVCSRATSGTRQRSMRETPEKTAADEFCGIGYSTRESTLSSPGHKRTKSAPKVEMRTPLRSAARRLPPTCQSVSAIDDDRGTKSSSTDDTQTDHRYSGSDSLIVRGTAGTVDPVLINVNEDLQSHTSANRADQSSFPVLAIDLKTDFLRDNDSRNPTSDGLGVSLSRGSDFQLDSLLGVRPRHNTTTNY